jgi:hypothetical protein
MLRLLSLQQRAAAFNQPRFPAIVGVKFRFSLNRPSSVLTWVLVTLWSNVTSEIPMQFSGLMLTNVYCPNLHI